MAGITRTIALIALGLVVFGGCSKSSDTSTAANGQTGEKKEDTAANSNPIGRAASDWLTAVLKGDTQRASALLTPQAMQRIIASGKQFSPPGLETAKFEIGKVIPTRPDQAIVQCVLTDTSEGTPHSEEMCCLMRLVENDWRVSGIAYGTATDQPWTMTNFETGLNTPISRQMPDASAGGVPYAPRNATPESTSRPSPRTAQEPAAAERR